MDTSPRPEVAREELEESQALGDTVLPTLPSSFTLRWRAGRGSPTLENTPGHSSPDTSPLRNPLAQCP